MTKTAAERRQDLLNAKEGTSCKSVEHAQRLLRSAGFVKDQNPRRWAWKVDGVHLLAEIVGVKKDTKILVTEV